MIEVRSVNYKINGSQILQDINLKIHRREMAAIIGPNGAGKSTLIRIILGIVHGFSGEVLIEHIPQKEWLRSNYFGYLPQHEHFDHHFPASARELVLMGIAGSKGFFHSFSRENREQADYFLEKVGLSGFAAKQIGDFSGGELQRLYLARALISGTEYLFLDEPEAGVDKRGVSLFYEILHELKDEGKTILIVSHDLAVTVKSCTMLICLNRTVHCHTQPELMSADIIRRTYGDVMQIIERQ